MFFFYSLQALQDIGVDVNEDRTVLRATRSGVDLTALFEGKLIIPCLDLVCLNTLRNLPLLIKK